MKTGFVGYYLNSKSYEQALQIQRWQGLDFICLYKVKRAKIFVDIVGCSS